MRTYKCALCHRFHLTSRTKGLRPPRDLARAVSVDFLGPPD
ncbi:hypothetical protein [Erythrobacter fulvus]|nr:hypothetical protein [Erythrobacter fulvus]